MRHADIKSFDWLFGCIERKTQQKKLWRVADVIQLSLTSFAQYLESFEPMSSFWVRIFILVRIFISERLFYVVFHTLIFDFFVMHYFVRNITQMGLLYPYNYNSYKKISWEELSIKVGSLTSSWGVFGSIFSFLFKLITSDCRDFIISTRFDFTCVNSFRDILSFWIFSEISTKQRK